MANKTGPVDYIKQVRSEGRKITWPSRHETMVSVIAVFIMVLLASAFLFFADQVIAYLILLVIDTDKGIF